MQKNQTKETFFIPVEDKYIIYLPHKPLAFIGNAAMVNFIKTSPAKSSNGDDKEVLEMLQQIGFFNPDKRSMPSAKAEQPFKPVIGVLLLTTACNLNCIYCYASAGPGQGQTMSVETGKWLIDQVCQNAKELGKNQFSLSIHGGGEPTVAWKRVLDLIHYAHSKDIKSKISITTNGYFSAEIADKLLPLITDVSFSFDGMEKIQNRQRPNAKGDGSFDKVFQTLKIIEDKNVPYGIRMSVMDDSVDLLPENIEFLCRNTKCQTFQVEPVFRSGRARTRNNSLKDQEKFVRGFMSAMQIAYEHGRHMYYSGVRPWLVTNNFCLAPQEALIINHNNELTTCYEVYDKKHELGELFFYGKLNGKNEVEMDFSKRQQLTQKIKDRQTNCIDKACFCFSHCAGDCPPKAFLSQENGESGFSPRCELNRELTKETLLFYIEKTGGIWHGNKVTKR